MPVSHRIRLFSQRFKLAIGPDSGTEEPVSSSAILKYSFPYYKGGEEEGLALVHDILDELARELAWADSCYFSRNEQVSYKKISKKLQLHKDRDTEQYVCYGLVDVGLSASLKWMSSAAGPEEEQISNKISQFGKIATEMFTSTSNIYKEPILKLTSQSQHNMKNNKIKKKEIETSVEELDD